METRYPVARPAAGRRPGRAVNRARRARSRGFLLIRTGVNIANEVLLKLRSLLEALPGLAWRDAMHSATYGLSSLLGLIATSCPDPRPRP